MTKSGIIKLIHDFKPTDTYEQMLIVQMVSCYTMSMEFSCRAMIDEQYLDAVDKHTNRATKLMRAFHPVQSVLTNITITTYSGGVPPTSI